MTVSEYRWLRKTFKAMFALLSNNFPVLKKHYADIIYVMTMTLKLGTHFLVKQIVLKSTHTASKDAICRYYEIV